jgi:hypothetical protein
MVVGSKVVYRGRMFTYIGETLNGLISLYSVSGSICVNKNQVRSI